MESWVVDQLFISIGDLFCNYRLFFSFSVLKKLETTLVTSLAHVLLTSESFLYLSGLSQCANISLQLTVCFCVFSVSFYRCEIT